MASATPDSSAAKRTKVLVVGGGNLEEGVGGESVTKVPIADYLHGLAAEFGHVTWFVEKSGTWGVRVKGANPHVKGVLDPERVSVVVIDGGVRGAIRNSLLFLGQILQRPRGVFFLPQIMTMVPCLPLARWLCPKFVIYLAGDYEVTLRDPREIAAHWPGWAFLYRNAYEWAMRFAHGVVARGAHLAAMARRCNRNVIQTIPLGHMHADTVEHPDDLPDDAPRRLLYIGLLIEAKGMNDLSSALRLVLDRRPDANIEIDVLGDGEDLEMFKQHARSLGLEAHVHFHGWVEERSRIDEFFAGAHALVMPTSTHPEGVPRSIDEALVRRVPVVATRIAGVPADFGDGEAYLVDPGHPEQIADGIEALLYDKDARASHLEGADRRRAQWSAYPAAANQHAAFLRNEIP